MSDTASLIDVMLARNVGTGTGYYRYDYDGYGEQVDGANFSSVGVGRVWPLLAGERGHLVDDLPFRRGDRQERGEFGDPQCAAAPPS